MNRCFKTLSRFCTPILISFFVISIFILIEIKHNYFFLQDDNRDYFLISYIYNFKSLLSGELPLYNFHQYLGMPYNSTGQPGVFYPLAYIACIISNVLFGHLFATIDILVIINFIIGSIGAYFLFKILLRNEIIATFGAITWPLCSFVVYVSDSWYPVASVVSFFPWMLLFSFLLLTKPSNKYVAGACVFRLLLFYAGHIQFFIYSVIFEVLFISIIIFERICWANEKDELLQFIKNYIISYICVFIFSLPLLLPMWYQTKISAFRTGPLSFHEFFTFPFLTDKLLTSLFFPFVPFNKIAAWAYANMPYLSFIGYIPILIIFIGLFIYLLINKMRLPNYIPGLITTIILCIILFFWVSNEKFNYIIYHVPILNRFRWPFKLALFFNFFLITFSTIILSRLANLIKASTILNKVLLWGVIIIHIISLSVFYLMSPYRAFGIHKDNPPLVEDRKILLSDGRLLSVDFDPWSRNGSACSLGFNYATLFGLFSYTGYCDPLITDTNIKNVNLSTPYTGIYSSEDGYIPIDHIRKWGVKWYLVSVEKVKKYETTFRNNGIVETVRDNKRVIYCDYKAYPFAYYIDRDHKLHTVDSKTTVNKIIVSTDLVKERDVILNYLYNPFFSAEIDGKKASISATDDNKMMINVPPGKHIIVVKYMDPYFFVGSIIALLYLVFLFICGLIKYRFSRKIFKELS